MTDSSVDPSTLAARASKALEGGQLDAAQNLYDQLERADPTAPQWPRQLATIHGRRGEADDELAALLRCAERHAALGESLPALATAKLILSIDPSHAAAQHLLTRLEPDQAVLVTYDDPAGRDLPPDDNDCAALDELVLTDTVEGARPASIADGLLEGVHEIPLQDVADIPAETDATPVRGARQAAAKGTPTAPPVAAQLEKSPLFQSLGPAAKSKLVRHAKLVQLAAGEVLFRQGDAPGGLYIVASGAVVPIAEEEPRTRLGVLEQGELFGEIALFTNQPRNATVEALVDTHLLEIDRPVMWSLVRKHPEVLSVLLGFLRERLIDRLLRTSALFSIFSSTKRSAIVRRFRFLEVADGHKVVDQHRPAEAVFILLAGRMDVVHLADDDAGGEADEKTLATINPGELFGEMSLLWREPSLASVIARGKCWLLALPASSFQEMLDHHPQLAAMAASIAEERRQQNQRTMRDALGHRDGTAGII